MTGFVQSLLNATKEDYEQLVKDIEARETELVALKDAARIVGLRLGLVEKKQHGGARAPRARKPDDGSEEQASGVEAPEPPAGTGKTEHYRILIKRYIQANGPTTMVELSRKTGIPNGSMTAALTHPMFVKTAIGYGLTENHR